VGYAAMGRKQREKNIPMLAGMSIYFNEIPKLEKKLAEMFMKRKHIENSWKLGASRNVL
jgi:hypothetical protein